MNERESAKQKQALKPSPAETAMSDSVTYIDNDNEDECQGCGSSKADRDKHGGYVGFHRCRHCDLLKCCMCDMGDDVECISCDNGA